MHPSPSGAYPEGDGNPRGFSSSHRTDRHGRIGDRRKTVPPMQIRDHGSLLRAESSIVVVIDMQEAFRSLHGFTALLPRAVQIVGAARALDIPIVGTELTPSRMGNTVEEIAALVDRRLFLPKESVSSLQVPDIAETIASSRARSVVLMGCEIHLAVLQTALQLMATFDSEVHVVVDCSTSRRDRDRDLALGRMQRAGVQLTSVEMVLFEWLRDMRHPRFATVTQKHIRSVQGGGSATGPSSAVV